MFADGTLACAVHRLTTVDASLQFDRAVKHLPVGTAVDLLVDGFERVQGHVAHTRRRMMTLSLSLPEEQRRALVLALYGRPNNNLPLQADLRRALMGLLRRSLRRD